MTAGNVKLEGRMLQCPAGVTILLGCSPPLWQRSRSDGLWGMPCRASAQSSQLTAPTRVHACNYCTWSPASWERERGIEWKREREGERSACCLLPVQRGSVTDGIKQPKRPSRQKKGFKHQWKRVMERKKRRRGKERRSEEKMRGEEGRKGLIGLFPFFWINYISFPL